MRGPGPTTALVGVIVTVVALALIFGLGAIFGLGPFNKEGELSRGQLIVRADAICAEANDAFAEQQAKQPQTPDQAAELTGHLVGIAEDEADRIAQLDGSPELDAELDAYLKARERGVELLKQGRTAAEDDDADGYEAAQAELERTQPERWRLAREIGFSECSRPQPSAPHATG